LTNNAPKRGACYPNSDPKWLLVCFPPAGYKQRLFEGLMNLPHGADNNKQWSYYDIAAIEKPVINLVESLKSFTLRHTAMPQYQRNPWPQ
jgi:hypothetical protein